MGVIEGLREETGMGYKTTVQEIRRKNNRRQFYVICPAPLAEALELEKGEEVEWVVHDRDRLIVLRRGARREGGAKR